MKALIAGLLMLASGAAYAAGYSKPAGAPSVFVPNHGVEVGVWAAQTPIGHGIGIFERSGTGDWNLCGQCLVAVEYPTLDSVVAGAGGAGPYVASKLADINAFLSIRYPAIGQEPTGTTLDNVNVAIQGYALRIIGGVPTLGSK